MFCRDHLLFSIKMSLLPTTTSVATDLLILDLKIFHARYVKLCSVDFKKKQDSDHYMSCRENHECFCDVMFPELSDFQTQVDSVFSPEMVNLYRLLIRLYDSKFKMFMATGQ